MSAPVDSSRNSASTASSPCIRKDRSCFTKRTGLWLHWASALMLMIYVIIEWGWAATRIGPSLSIRVLGVVAAIDVFSAAIASLMHRQEELVRQKQEMEAERLRWRVRSANTAAVFARDAAEESIRKSRDMECQLYNLQRHLRDAEKRRPSTRF